MQNAPAYQGTDGRDRLVALSHLRWDFVFQRPQHLLTRASRDYRVSFIEEPVFEGTNFDVRRLNRGGVTVVQPVVPEGSAPDAVEAHELAVIAAECAKGAARLVLWFYSPMFAPTLGVVSPDAIVFDKMDELSAFAFAPAGLRAREAEVVAAADVVFTGGQAMFEAAQGRHPNLHCFPSSIDTAHFARARERALPDPADQANIAHPRIGFFGVIDERIDLDLIAATAALKPDWQFLFLGPTAKIDPASLPQAPNIHWLGSKKYADLPAYLAHWDAGWMPFAMNDATKFISPTKTPEFLAAGLPVVSTPITDVVRPYGVDGLVWIASTPEQAVALLERCLTPQSDNWRTRVDARLALGSWDRTWDAMRGLIEDALAATTPHKESEYV
ncbi:MAG: glycosyltransferase [Sphingomonadaceae bacterium]|nr:glycosyltransferase [Sphingomonadaceae bacterium]